MRILHISTRLILGGSQENTVLSCEGQSRLGHEVHLAFGPIYGPEGSFLPRVDTFNAAAEQPITTHVIDDMVRELNPVRDWKALRQTRSLIDAIQPDIVHTHSSKAGVIGRLAAWRSKARPGIVHTVHGPPFMPVEGSFLSQQKIKRKNDVYTLAERHAAKRCHIIACVCEAMRDQFLERRIGTPEQYEVVYSGMEIDGFLRARENEDRASVRTELRFTDDDFVIGTVARLAEHKGHDDVLDALSEDLKRDPKLKLLWVGEGWWGERLRARVSSMGIDKQVVFTGLVPGERVPAMMRAMDVLVHPSYREGLPRTVPQALLSGTAVVATDADGTREVCIDGKTGRLVPVANTKAIGDALRWMRDHPKERAAMTAHGREMCQSKFSAEAMVEALETVYKAALAKER
ncbi:MAG: glycosyltransferase family 4 protein [Planctomycetota bacterium]